MTSQFWGIWNFCQRKWVAPAGQRSSYTGSPHLAATFKTREEAIDECCIQDEAPKKLPDAAAMPQGRYGMRRRA